MLSASIDFTNLSYPTDRLTVKDLRCRCPEGFDLPLSHESFGEVRKGLYRRRSLDVVLGDLVDLEREIADRAFHTRLSAEVPEHLRGHPDDGRDCLISEYVRWGLATGENHAEQLIRDLETQAITQAEQVGKIR